MHPNLENQQQVQNTPPVSHYQEYVFLLQTRNCIIMSSSVRVVHPNMELTHGPLQLVTCHDYIVTGPPPQWEVMQIFSAL